MRTTAAFASFLSSTSLGTVQHGLLVIPIWRARPDLTRFNASGAYSILRWILRARVLTNFSTNLSEKWQNFSPTSFFTLEEMKLTASSATQIQKFNSSCVFT